LRKGITVLLILLSLTIMLTACQASERNEDPNNADKQVETKLIQETMNDPREGASWTKIDEFNVDLDGDSKEDMLGLYTAAERDERGNLMWDDGQNWLLLVQMEDKFIPLLSEYVQLGSVYFTVAKDSQDKITKITIIVPTGANLKLVNYSYDQDKQGFIEEPIYSSSEDNFIHSTIPSYS